MITGYSNKISVATTTCQGVLDIYPTNAIGGYSVARRLTNTYSGALIRVRRGLDNAEQDIGYNNQNELDISAIESFCGASFGYVTRVYPQKTNSISGLEFLNVYLGAATSVLQPTIYDGANIYYQNGRPCPYFNGANALMTILNGGYTGVIDTFSVFDVWDTSYLGTRNFWGSFGESSFIRTEGNDQAWRGVLGFNQSVANGYFTNFNLGVVNVLFNGTQSAIYRNNNVIQGGINLGTNALNFWVWGARSFSGARDSADRFARINIPEQLFYSADTNFDRGLIGQNQKDFYNIL